MSTFVEALREARTQIEAAASTSKVQPGEAAVARRIGRELERAIARLDGGEGDKDLISIVCHDLKDPLASIVMGAGFLRKTAAAEDATAARVVGAIARSADRMNQLVGDFHDLAKLEEGRLQIERRPCDVVATLRGAMGVLEAIAKERSVTLAFEAPEGPLVVSCDASRLVQAVTKLAGNALRFTPAAGRVTVRVAREEDAVRVTVQDTGRGIAAERLPTIFDHAANARRTPRDGPGLGLAIVRGLVELHGGTVGVSSRVGEGSSFSFTLPTAA
jgi:signal transduction histidine kinase